MNPIITKSSNIRIVKIGYESIIPRKRGFTLVELVISVGLLIVALSIALFAVIGTNGLIQKTEARGVISDSGRSVGDVVRRAVNNAPNGAVSPYEANPDGVTFAAVRVKDVSTLDAGLACTTIGRATVTAIGGEEQYTIDDTGTIIALIIHSVDSGGLCPALSTSPIYQNRLTSSQVVAKDLRFYLHTIACETPTPSCQTKQFLRYTLTLEQLTKDAGGTTEARKPSLSFYDGLGIGLVNEATTALKIETSALASGVVGSAYSDTLTSSGGLPAYSWSVTSGTLPTGLSLAPSTGVISGTPTVANTYNFTVKVTDSLGANVSKALSIVINSPPAALTITTSSLPDGTVGVSYSATLTATGGTAPYLWSIVSGGLPAGLSLTAGTGAITGTPTTTGTSNFTTQVTDSVSATATKALSIVIVAGGTLTITTNSPLPPANVGVNYTTTLAASGGTAPYTWTLAVGPLPPGMSLSTAGVISGFCFVPGTFNFTVRVTDAVLGTVTKPLSITVSMIGPPP